MSRQESIYSKLQQALEPLHLEVIDESHMHNVPAGSESHFKVTLVSDRFDGQMLIKRHRAVNQALVDVMSDIHALALHTMTPDEWFEKGKAAESPPCEGGSKN